MVENQTKTQVREDSSLCSEISKNAVQEFHLRVGTLHTVHSMHNVEEEYILRKISGTPHIILILFIDHTS